jgi:hypothetical protein
MDSGSKHHATSLYRIKSHASAILNLPGTYFTSDFDHLGAPDLQTRLKWDVNQTQYSLFPPILYPNLKMDDTLMFRNEAIPWVSSIYPDISTGAHAVSDLASRPFSTHCFESSAGSTCQSQDCWRAIRFNQCHPGRHCVGCNHS